MLKAILLFLKGLGLCLLVLFVFQTGKIVLSANRTDYSAKPFERLDHPANFKVLFLGDSTAVGVGSGNPRNSTAGWFSQDFPEAGIENISQSGLRLAGLRGKLKLVKTGPYDLIVIQIGANDIMHLTPLNAVDRDIRFVLKTLTPQARQIIFLHSGDVGTAPIFIWPFTWIFSKRSYQVRAIYQKAAQDTQAFYVDLIGRKIDRVFGADQKKYYALDGLHLTGEGYRIWYRAIREKLNNAGSKL